MFEAQLLLAPSEAGAGYKVFSPWFPRQGDNATLTVETVDQDGGPQLDVTAFTKNSEDPGDGTLAASGPTITASATPGNRVADTWTGNLKELVRYQFEITSESGSGEWVLFRMLPPVWFDSVHSA